VSSARTTGKKKGDLKVSGFGRDQGRVTSNPGKKCHHREEEKKGHKVVQRETAGGSPWRQWPLWEVPEEKRMVANPVTEIEDPKLKKRGLFYGGGEEGGKRSDILLVSEKVLTAKKRESCVRLLFERKRGEGGGSASGGEKFRGRREGGRRFLRENPLFSREENWSVSQRHKGGILLGPDRGGGDKRRVLGGGGFFGVLEGEGQEG